MCRPVSWMFKNFQTLFTIGSIALAIVLWFTTMNNIPVKVESLNTRVEKISDRVTVLEKTMAQQSTQEVFGIIIRAILNMVVIGREWLKTL